jgi:Fur family transcriptional regulator, ferric uptake regulator
LQTHLHLQFIAMERQTRQQHAVMQAIIDTGRSLSPQEVCSLAQQVVPRINLSTVYRQLKVLQMHGRVVRVELPGQPARFEAARGHQAMQPQGQQRVIPLHSSHASPALAHHHHFHCVACEQVFPLHACPGGMDKLVPPGYEVQHHHLTLRGRCPACVRATA